MELEWHNGSVVGPYPQVPVSKPGSNIKRMWVCLERLFPEVGLMFPIFHGGNWPNPQHVSVLDVNEIGSTFILFYF